MTDPRRELPSVGKLLEEPRIAALIDGAPRSAVVAAIRDVLAGARKRAGVPDDWAVAVRERLLERAEPSLNPVLNATGIVLHTNLGRAPLAEAAQAAVAAIAGGYSTLEFDLHAGIRGHRADHSRDLLAELTGADDALVVNNAAGALVLALQALSRGREVIISRGELIEIGGSFRIPEILETSGATLREIGTTNRTHLQDYETAIGTGTGAILIVHRSNFAQRGFVASPEPSEVAALATARGIPCIYDVGSGLLADLSDRGLTSEPRVVQAVASGASLVIFSGDKLLGGPQAGCLVGSADLIRRCREHPLARALRADKLTLAALDATLRLYQDPDRARREIPVLAMLSIEPKELERRAERLRTLVPGSLRPRLISGASNVGGGSFPDAELPTTLVALDPGPLGADGLALRLRLGRPPVIARVKDGQLLLDPRTLPEAGLADVGAALRRALETDA
ncbi:MAG TPA: L-seryl-tRNA(Sec) selenium transferase [Gemmatimonadales bacterium]|nr:L-seryl-tRNA(Sec) selenium transferase [Gemmatimonadales bacterium]